MGGVNDHPKARGRLENRGLGRWGRRRRWRRRSCLRSGEQRNLRYVRDAGEAVEQVARGQAEVAFLTNPVTLGQLREVAFAGDVVPQKSSDFYPKLLSGLAIYALD